ncbi:response regulator [Spirosoma knui]
MIDILYVEDNEDDADIFSRLIHKMDRPVTYTIVRSGSEAIDYLTAQGQQTPLPKLLLLDLNLIGLSGLDVLKCARSTKRTRRLPVVAFSTSDSPNDIEHAYDAGINAYLVKPGNYQDTKVLLQRLCQFWLEDNTRID